MLSLRDALIPKFNTTRPVHAPGNPSRPRADDEKLCADVVPPIQNRIETLAAGSHQDLSK